MNNIFIGRNTELDYYRNNLEVASEGGAAAIVHYLSGSKGIGKKTFHSKLGELVLAGRSHGWLWIQPENISVESDTRNWLGLFARSITSNVSSLSGPIRDLQQKVAGKPGMETREWVEALNAAAGVAFAGDTQSTPSAKVIFVLNDYDQWNAGQKQWFSETIFKPTQSDDFKSNAVFLISGESSFIGTETFAKYWGLGMEQVTESRLNPLTEDEVKTFFQASNFPLDQVADLHKRSKGIPQSLMNLLATFLEKNHAAQAALQFRGIVDAVKEHEIKWLLWAAHLGQITLESLSIFCGDEEAQHAYEWLLQFDGIELKRYPDKYVFDGSIIGSLLAWEKEQNPDAFKANERKASGYHQIVAVIPNKEDRTELAKLSVFRYFNEALLKEIYPEEWGALVRFIRSHDDYFQETDENLKIADDIYRTIKDYTALIPLPDESKFQEAIEKIWVEKRSQVIKEMALMEQELSAQEATITTVRTSLRNLLGQIHGHENTLKNARRLELEKNRVEAPKFTIDMAAILYHVQLMLGILVIIGGIIFLYVGFVFSDQMIYSAVGIFMIVAGIFWPYKKRPLVKVNANAETGILKPKTDAVSSSPLSGNKHLRVLNMELTDLENKRSVLSRNIAKLRRGISASESVLSEPYI